MASPMVCVADYERFAEEHLSKSVKDYFNTGAFYEDTLIDNVESFQRYKFRPRYMVDVSEVSMTTTLLGQPVRCPLGVSPMTPCTAAHPQGEAGLVRACQAEGVCFCLSLFATTSMEEIGQAAPDSLRWFHIEMMSDRDMMRRLVARAEKAGFKAIVLTVDCITLGIRYQNLRNESLLPYGYPFHNFDEEIKRKRSSGDVNPDADVDFLRNVYSSVMSWTDVQWLKSVTCLPVVVKGIITGHDARQALDHGADAIWVSNHGGRTLNCLPASIDTLGEVCQAVGGRAEVYLDGGVRSGLDVLKALSRGARAVFVGRPALWGLVIEVGQQGTQNVLTIVRAGGAQGWNEAGSERLSGVGNTLHWIVNTWHQPHHSTVERTLLDLSILSGICC